MNPNVDMENLKSIEKREQNTTSSIEHKIVCLTESDDEESFLIEEDGENGEQVLSSTVSSNDSDLMYEILEEAKSGDDNHPLLSS